MILKIKAKRNGFRRAGITFSDTETTEVDTSKLKEEEIEALKNEPMLLVVEAAGGKTEKGNAGLNVQELKDKLTALKVEFPPNAAKAALVALLDEAEKKTASTS